MTDRPLFIVGCPRSGTSLTAKAFEACGIWAGKTTSLGENMAIKDGVLKPMLVAGGMDDRALIAFNDVGGDPGQIRRDVLAVLADQGYSGGPWLFKDVKLVFCWRAWAEAFPDAIWVTVWRHPSSILDSFKRWKLSEKVEFDGARVIAEHWRRAMGIPSVHIEPDVLLFGQDHAYREVCNQMGVRWDPEAVMAVIDPDRFHARKKSA